MVELLCPKCKRSINPDDKFCPYCDFVLHTVPVSPIRIHPTKRVRFGRRLTHIFACHICGNKLEINITQCPYCGAKTEAFPNVVVTPSVKQQKKDVTTSLIAIVFLFSCILFSVIFVFHSKQKQKSISSSPVNILQIARQHAITGDVHEIWCNLCPRSSRGNYVYLFKVEGNHGMYWVKANVWVEVTPGGEFVQRLIQDTPAGE